MKSVVITAEWRPKPSYKANKKDTKPTYTVCGNSVMHNPKWSLEAAPEPEIIHDDDVLIRIHACGICGSDVHMYEKDREGYMVWPGEITLPIVPGHEFSGEVVRVGKGAKKIRVGDLVTAEEIDVCGQCFACQMGYRCQCEEHIHGMAPARGFTVPGGLAEYIVVREPYCWKLNSILEAYEGDRKATLEAGALTEPFSVAYEALFKRAGGILPGGHVLIFGGGPIGLAAVQLIKTSGAARIIAVEPVEERRQLAVRNGADFALDPSQDSLQEEIMRITGGGASMLIEAAGAFSKTFPIIRNCMQVGGKIAVIGVSGERPDLNMIDYQRAAAAIYPSLGHAGSFPLVLNLVAARRISPRDTITSRFPLAEYDKAMQTLSKRVDGKILVTI